MAYGVKPPPLGDYAFNLAESADFMFDHAIYNDCMANVDYSEQVVKDTNPALLKKAEETSAPHSDIHGYKTIADIMRALNAFTGSFYLETLQVARYTREMYCLFGGRHTHPSTIMPGGCSADITHQTLTDYYVRLMRYMDYAKRTVPMHDDLYDFFLQELPGYDMVGFRETDLVCWGAFDDPQYVDYSYRNMTEWGRHRWVTPGLVFKGELITTDLVEINLAIRILLGSSYFDDWTNEQTFVTKDPLGNDVDKRHPWNKVTLPKPQARDWADKYSWVASPRMYDKRNDTFVANDTGGGPFARQWVTAKAGLVDIGYLKATGHSLQMVLPKTGFMPEMELEWKIPEKSNAIERQRARTYHQAYSALVGLHNLEMALKRGPRRAHEVVERLQRSRRGGQRRLPRGGARRAVAPHGHPRRQDRQLPALPADAVERQPARLPRDAGPLRGRGDEHADLRGERPRQLQGDRHHAGGALVRPVPAVRGAHVRQGQGAKGGPHADGDVLMAAAADVSERLIERVQELTDAARGGPGLPGAGGGRRARLVGHGAVRRGPAADLRRLGRRRRDRGAGARPPRERRGGREPDVDPRPVPRAARNADRARRSTACARTWSPTAVTSSSSRSSTAWRGCVSSGTARAARRRRRRSSWRSRRRWRRRRPTSRASRSRASSSRPLPPPAAGGLELPVIQSGVPAWTDLEAATPASGTTASMTVAGADLLVANVGGTLLAYRNTCGWCQARLDAAPMTPGGTLTCPSCERRFELRRAGRSPDDDGLQIAPVPLLRGEGRVRVAVG